MLWFQSIPSLIVGSGDFTPRQTEQPLSRPACFSHSFSTSIVNFLSSSLMGILSPHSSAEDAPRAHIAHRTQARFLSMLPEPLHVLPAPAPF